MGRISLLFLLVLLFACDEVSVPKPAAYYRIDLPERSYENWNSSCPFAFKISSEAKIERNKLEQKDCYFDLVYPKFNATLYLSYLPVEGNLKSLIDQEYQLREKHNAFSTGVSERVYQDSSRKVNAMLFEVEGLKAATPLQFFITDSTTHFFRAALYFYNTPNNDSLAPVINYIKEDVGVLVESFEWRN